MGFFDGQTGRFPRVDAAGQEPTDPVKSDADQLAHDVVVLAGVGGKEHQGLSPGHHPADPGGHVVAVGHGVRTWDVAVVETAFRTRVDQNGFVVQMIPDREGGQRGHAGDAAQDVRASAVDVGHVFVVARVGAQTGEGESYEARFLSFGGEGVGQPLMGDGGGRRAAPGRRRAERPSAVGRVDLDVIGQLEQFFVDGVV